MCTSMPTMSRQSCRWASINNRQCRPCKHAMETCSTPLSFSPLETPLRFKICSDRMLSLKVAAKMLKVALVEVCVTKMMPCSAPCSPPSRRPSKIKCARTMVVVNSSLLLGTTMMTPSCRRQSSRACSKSQAMTAIGSPLRA